MPSLWRKVLLLLWLCSNLRKGELLMNSEGRSMQAFINTEDATHKTEMRLVLGNDNDTYDVRWPWVIHFSQCKNGLPSQRLRGHPVLSSITYVAGTLSKAQIVQTRRGLRSLLSRSSHDAERGNNRDTMRLLFCYKHEDRTDVYTWEGSETSPLRCWRNWGKEMESNGTSGCGEHMSKATAESKPSERVATRVATEPQPVT